jgi:hypothetical protein
MHIVENSSVCRMSMSYMVALGVGDDLKRTVVIEGEEWDSTRSIEHTNPLLPSVLYAEGARLKIPPRAAGLDGAVDIYGCRDAKANPKLAQYNGDRCS